MSEIPDIRSAILNKTHELFKQFGIRSVSMDDIASALSVSKKTIYHHFSDKNELVEEIVGRILDTSRNVCEIEESKKLNAIHEGFLALERMADIFADINPGFIYDLHKYHPAAYAKFTNFKSGYLFETVKKNLISGIEEGLYRADIDTDLISRFRVESIVVMFDPEFQKNMQSDLQAINKELFYLFLYGLVTLKGYKLIEKYKQHN